MPPGAAAQPLQELLGNLPETLAGFKANPFLPRTSNASDRFSALFSGQSAVDIRAWPEERLHEASALIAEVRASLAAPQNPYRGTLGRLKIQYPWPRSIGSLVESKATEMSIHSRSAAGRVKRPSITRPPPTVSTTPTTGPGSSRTAP